MNFLLRITLDTTLFFEGLYQGYIHFYQKITTKILEKFFEIIIPDF